MQFFSIEKFQDIIYKNGPEYKSTTKLILGLFKQNQVKIFIPFLKNSKKYY